MSGAPCDTAQNDLTQIAPMLSTGPDLTETTTASREPTDAEPQVAGRPVAESPSARPDAADNDAADIQHLAAETPAQASFLVDEPVVAAAASPSESEPAKAGHDAGEDPDEDETPDEMRTSNRDQPSLIPIAAG